MLENRQGKLLHYTATPIPSQLARSCHLMSDILRLVEKNAPKYLGEKSEFCH